MLGIFAGLSVVSKILNAVSMNQYGSYAEIGTAIGKVLSSSDNVLLSTKGSITKLLGRYIIEPTIIVSDGAKNIASIDKVIDLNMDIFASYYMQAFDILRMQFGKNVNVAIDILGTGNGSVSKAAGAAMKVLGRESADKDYLAELFSNESFSLTIEDNEPTTGTKINSISGSNSADNFKNQPTSVIAYRNLDITTSTTVIVDGKQQQYTIVLPLIIRADVRFASMDNILLLLKPNHYTKSASFRWDEYKSGGISLSNLIFCGDLIEDYKKNKFRDKAGLLDIVHNRESSANLKAAYTKTIGFEKYYQMLIVTDSDKSQLNKQVNGDIGTEKFKQELLEQAHCMTCTVLDEAWDRGHVYTKDLSGQSVFSLKKLGNRKDSGVDLTEIVKAMMGNKPPVF